jgi:hypothetical protein
MSTSILKDPTLHFVIIGISLWWILSGEPSKEDIRIAEVSWAAQAEAEATFLSQKKRAPSPKEQKTLLDGLIREEVLVREALRLDLQKRDPIVRKRLVQKMEAIASLAQKREPKEGELRSFYSENLERYKNPSRTSLEHHFFSIDQRGVTTPSDAISALKLLRKGTEPLSDPFIRGRKFTLRTTSELARIFGDEFVKNLPEKTLEWTRVGSTFGEHVVRITEGEKETVPPFEAIRSQVRTDWANQADKNAGVPWYLKLKETYRVRVMEPIQ